MKKKKNFPYNVYIIGFMASGKSTLLGAFARIYRMDVCDTDREIEKNEGMSAADLFRSEGMDHFIKKELEVLEKMDRRKGMIVSLGGETPLTAEKLAIIKKGKVVFLKTPADEIIKRILRRDTRPTAQGRTEEELREMLENYEKEYEKFADLVITTDGQSAAAAADRIMEQLYI